jgi:hypothetical protein
MDGSSNLNTLKKHEMKIDLSSKSDAYNKRKHESYMNRKDAINKRRCELHLEKKNKINENRCELHS